MDYGNTNPICVGMDYGNTWSEIWKYSFIPCTLTFRYMASPALVTHSLFRQTLSSSTVQFLIFPASDSFSLFLHTLGSSTVHFLIFSASVSFLLFRQTLSRCFISLIDPSIRMPALTFGRYFGKGLVRTWAWNKFSTGWFRCIPRIPLLNPLQLTFFRKRKWGDWEDLDIYQKMLNFRPAKSCFTRVCFHFLVISHALKECDIENTRKQLLFIEKERFGCCFLYVLLLLSKYFRSFITNNCYVEPGCVRNCC